MERYLPTQWYWPPPDELGMSCLTDEVFFGFSESGFDIYSNVCETDFREEDGGGICEMQSHCAKKDDAHVGIGHGCLTISGETKRGAGTIRENSLWAGCRRVRFQGSSLRQSDAEDQQALLASLRGRPVTAVDSPAVRSTRRRRGPRSRSAGKNIGRPR